MKSINLTFIRSVSVILIPIFLQGMVTVLLNFVDVFMLAKLGEASLAAASINFQVFFVYLMVVFSVSSGVAVFVAQSHGAKEPNKIHSYHALGLQLGFLISVIFIVVLSSMPEKILGLYTDDAQVLAKALEFLQVTLPIYAFYFITNVYFQVLRSVTKVKLPLVASVLALSLNTVLNYGMIFGKLGFEEYGFIGAAYATLISRTLELLITIILTYKERNQAALPMKKLFVLNESIYLVPKFISVSRHILSSTILWVLGTNVYMIMYAQKGVESFAALNIALSFEKVGLVLISSLGQTAGIIIGKMLGENEFAKAKDVSKVFLITSIVFSLIISLFIIVSGSIFVSHYGFEQSTMEFVQSILISICIIMLFKSINIVTNMGVLRSGGDTKFIMYSDFFGVWLIGVPIAIFLVKYTTLSLPIIIIIVGLEELVKNILCLSRMRTDKWLVNVVK